MLKTFLSSLFIFSCLSGIFLSTTLFADPYAKSGNIKPSIVELSEEEEAKILSGVKVPDGFELTLYAPWQTANYPVYVAASPAGDLYVSSDGCGSLGRDKDRGRVLRLRDKDGDGRADEVTEFIPSIDSPRGLIWDQDRLYVLHPPHLSVYYDRDGDGVAEENKRLVDNIAFSFKERPADHTTNGLDLGIDGWLYVSTGDLDFLRPPEAMDVNCRFVEAAWPACALTAPALSYFPTAPAIFLPYPLAPCSTYSDATTLTTAAGGMYDFTTSAGWTIMATPGFI